MEGGGTYGQALIGLIERAEARGDRKKAEGYRAELNGPEFPEELLYLWEWYRDLSQERDFGPMGDPLPLKSPQFLAWQSLLWRRLNRWEIDILKQLDLTERIARHDQRDTDKTE